MQNWEYVCRSVIITGVSTEEYRTLNFIFIAIKWLKEEKGSGCKDECNVKLRCCRLVIAVLLVVGQVQISPVPRVKDDEIFECTMKMKGGDSVKVKQSHNTPMEAQGGEEV
jgi:hypothetical protein